MQMHGHNLTFNVVIHRIEHVITDNISFVYYKYYVQIMYIYRFARTSATIERTIVDKHYCQYIGIGQHLL